MKPDPTGYYLPNGYEPNPPISGDDRGPGYWTPRRLERTERWQWHAYQWAADHAYDRGLRTVVDLGCGTGVKLERFFAETNYIPGHPRWELFGVDQPAAVAMARERGAGVTYVADDLSRPSSAILEALDGRHVDLVLSCDVIEHLGDPDTLCDLIHAIADEDTHIVLSTPDRVRLAPETLDPASRRPSNPAHVREWSEAEFRYYLESRGFKIMEHHHVLPFRPGLNRMTERYAVERFRRGLPWDTCQVVGCLVA